MPGYRRLGSIQQEFTIANLQLLSWKDHNGERKTYSVTSQVQHKWQTIGIQLGFHLPHIQSLECKYSSNPTPSTMCLIQILDQWIRNGVQQNVDRYCPTWDGLTTLLCDIEEGGVAEKIRKILCE